MRVKHVGPRKPYAPPPLLAYDLSRLKLVLPRLTIDEQRDVQRIIDAQGVGYNVRYLAGRYERLAQPDRSAALRKGQGGAGGNMRLRVGPIEHLGRVHGARPRRKG